MGKTKSQNLTLTGLRPTRSGLALNVDGVQIACGFRPVPRGGLPTKSQCERIVRACDRYFDRIGKPWLKETESLFLFEIMKNRREALA